MLRIDFTNLMSDKVGNENGITSDDLNALKNNGAKAHQKIQEWRGTQDAYFYDVVFDDKLTDGIAEKAIEIAKEFDNVVVLGIGGSALGLRCCAQALLPPFWNLKDRAARNNHPRLFVCDNIDPDTFANLLELVDPKKTCFTVISKSGKTTETASQFFLVMAKLKELIGDSWHKNVVIITDPESGELRPMVKEFGMSSFEIPPKLGGRFSVLCAVGLFPAACVGIDIEALVSGAADMANRCSKENLEDNPAYQLGGYHYWFDAHKGKNVSVMMTYSDALMLAADWYAQLWAESLGKDGKGQTPMKALGPTDQHSQVQLYMEGPADKIFNIIGTESFTEPADKTLMKKLPEAFSYMENRDLGTILKAEERATIGALTEYKRPNLTVTFPKIDAHHLGEFFMLYELATAYAGALYEINPFNQPGVELGKKLTKEILTK